MSTYTDLHRAIDSSDDAAFETIVKSAVDARDTEILNVEYKRFMSRVSPLEASILADNKHAFDTLLSLAPALIDINKGSPAILSAIHHGVRTQDWYYANELLKHAELDLTRTNIAGNTILQALSYTHISTREGIHVYTKILDRVGKSQIDKTSAKRPDTPLEIAGINNNAEVFKLLIRKGANTEKVIADYTKYSARIRDILNFTMFDTAQHTIPNNVKGTIYKDLGGGATRRKMRRKQRKYSYKKLRAYNK